MRQTNMIFFPFQISVHVPSVIISPSSTGLMHIHSYTCGEYHGDSSGMLALQGTEEYLSSSVFAQMS